MLYFTGFVCGSDYHVRNQNLVLSLLEPLYFYVVPYKSQHHVLLSCPSVCLSVRLSHACPQFKNEKLLSLKSQNLTPNWSV